MKIKFIILTCSLIVTTKQYCTINLVNHSPYQATIYFENINNQEIGKVKLNPGEGISFERKSHHVLKKMWTIKHSFDAFKLDTDVNPGEELPEPTIIRTEEFDTGRIDPALVAGLSTYHFTLKKVIPIGFYGSLILDAYILRTTVAKPEARYLALNSAINPLTPVHR